MDRCETFRNCGTIISLWFLKVLHLYTIPCGFYEPPNEQNRMCELCTFSQIRSHMGIVLSIAIGLPYDHCSKACTVDKNRAALVQMLHSYIVALMLALYSIMKNIVMNISLHRWPIRVLVIGVRPICQHNFWNNRMLKEPRIMLE